MDKSLRRFASYTREEDARQVLRALERALVFLASRVRREGLDKWSDDVSRIALTLGHVLERECGWEWALFQDASGKNLALVDAERRHLVLPVDFVMGLLEGGRMKLLLHLFDAVDKRTLPEAPAGTLRLIDGEALERLTP